MDAIQGSQGNGWKAPRWFRRALMAGGSVVFCLTLVLFSAVSTPRVAQADPPPPGCQRQQCAYNHVWDPGSCQCKELRPPPCPAGTIDIQGNGQNDGGDDCQPFRYITPPTSCNPTSPDGNGNVNCFLPHGGLGWDWWNVQASMGCLAIDRQPFPRALVNYPMQPGGDPGTKLGLHDSAPPSGNDGMLHR